MAKLFSRKNETRLQLLENELAGISQGTLSISQYFTEVKNFCREISQLDPKEKISEARMRRIIIHGLRPEYNGFMAAVRGWPTQPSLVELENLLANQEALAKEMGRITLKEQDEEEALFVGRKKSPLRAGKEMWTRSERWCPKESSYSGEAQRRREEDQDELIEERRKRGECFNCGKKGHLARYCWSPKKHSEGNVATAANATVKENPSDEEWDAEAAIYMEDDEVYCVEDLTEYGNSSTGDATLEEYTWKKSGMQKVASTWR